MDAILVTFEQTVRIQSKVYLHEDHQQALRSRFGDGPYTAEQLTEYLEDEQVTYFDEDEAEFIQYVVPERDIITAKVVPADD